MALPELRKRSEARRLFAFSPKELFESRCKTSFCPNFAFFAALILQMRTTAIIVPRRHTQEKIATAMITSVFFSFPQSPFTAVPPAHSATQRPEASWKGALLGQESTHSACPTTSTKKCGHSAMQLLLSALRKLLQVQEYASSAGSNRPVHRTFL